METFRDSVTDSIKREYEKCRPHVEHMNKCYIELNEMVR